MTTIRRIITAPTLLALTLLIIVSAACQAASTNTTGPTTNYSATVNASLPTSEAPTPSPAAATATPPPTIQLTYTPWPKPTYTPWPKQTYTPRPPPSSSTVDGRPTAPTFQATMLDGSEFKLTDAIGSPALIAFWAPW